MRRLRQLAKIVGLALVVAAVLEEYNKPPDKRTGQGRAMGTIPYDFRLPTLERLVRAYWNPDDPRLFTETPFGVGWALNLYRLRKLVREWLEVRSQ